MAEFPLHYAAGKGEVDTVRSFLLNEFNVDALDQFGMTALHYACKEGFTEVAELLLDSGACIDGAAPYIPLDDDIYESNCFTALHFAAGAGRGDCVKLLLRRGAVVHSLGAGCTALHLACGGGFWEIAEHLLKYGAEVNVAATATFPEGTPLHRAAASGCVKTVELLLGNDAKVDALNYFGVTPLYTACMQGKLNVIEVLVKNGACVNHIPPNNCPYGGLTPLEYIWKKGPIKAFEIITKHLIKIEAQSLFICEGNLCTVSENDEIKSFAEKCRNEIEKIRRTTISGSNVTFFHVLTKEENKLADYAANECVEEVLESGYYKSEFPIYESLISDRFLRGRQRRDLLIKSSELLYDIVNEFYKFPYVSAEKINKYLTNRDLKLQINEETSQPDI